MTHQSNTRVFQLDDTVRIVEEGHWANCKGRIVNIFDHDPEATPLYGVVFPWDVDSIPVYFSAEELEYDGYFGVSGE